MLIYTKAINLQPSIIGYIAKSIALVGKGERHNGYRSCDIAFERFHSSHVTFLLLIKVCIFYLGVPHLLISFRPSLYSWPESIPMRYRA